MILAALAWSAISLAGFASPLVHDPVHPTGRQSQSATTTEQNSAPGTNASPAAATPEKTEIAVPERTVVLDAGHGGADAGARGTSGVTEKDLTLAVAQVARSVLVQHGFHVVMTREGDQDPSFDDRSGKANAERNAVFLSFHVSSTGSPGTVRCYAYPRTEGESAAGSAPGGTNPIGTIHWEQAQQPYAELSRKLADLMQVEFSQSFAGSPEIGAEAAVRDLRSVALPAVAIEVSNISGTNPKIAEEMALTLGSGAARAIESFWPVYEPRRR
jgi:N-acetylmuramoyl-L-alanine amidase